MKHILACPSCGHSGPGQCLDVYSWHRRGFIKICQHHFNRILVPKRYNTQDVYGLSATGPPMALLRVHSHQLLKADAQAPPARTASVAPCFTLVWLVAGWSRDYLRKRQCVSFDPGFFFSCSSQGFGLRSKDPSWSVEEVSWPPLDLAPGLHLGLYISSRFFPFIRSREYLNLYPIGKHMSTIC